MKIMVLAKETVAMNLEICKREDAITFSKAYNLELNWTGSDCYKIIKDNKVIGLMLYRIFVRPKRFMIFNLEVFEKGKGIGSEIVKEIKNKNIDICLYVNSERSRIFWEKQGFKEIDNGAGRSVHYFRNR